MALLQDLRYGLRTMVQWPLATIVAVLALALGIGVNVSSFVAVNAMVLHPFPFPKLERIMTIWETAKKSPDERDELSPANFLDWKKQSSSFQEIAAYRGWAASLTGTREPVSVRATRVSEGFFRVVGTSAMMGRPFSANESRAVVVSEGFWREHLGGAREALGKQIALNGASYTVVAVMPAEFEFPMSNDIWVPLTMTAPEEGERSERSLHVVGLLKPGVTAEQALAEAREIGQRLEKQFPGTNEGRSMRVMPILDVTNEVTDKFILLLLGAATMVLLLACANVTNLQLARAARREKEIAVRAALGASRFQIARQLITESVLIALAGGVCALFLAGWNLDMTNANIPAEAFAQVPGLRMMRIDATVIAYTFGISVLAGVIACLPAIFRLVRQRSLTDLNEALQMGGRTSDTSTTAGRNRLQGALIVFEVAMAMALLVNATLMVKAFNGLLTGHFGYEAKNILRLQVALPPASYGTVGARIAFYDRALDKLRNVTGAQAAAVWSDGPSTRMSVEGRPLSGAEDSRAEMEAVSSEFLQAMRMPLLQGRFVSEHDRPDTEPVVVVSAVVAHEYWPNSNAIGQRIKLGRMDSPWVTVVGVSGDMVRDWLTNHPSHLVYVPYTQAPMSGTIFVVRTVTDPQLVAKGARAKIREINPDLPIYAVESMERYLFDQMSGVRAAADTMTRYAGVALMLAATGIFGVISFFVAQKTRDIGVHMALGANTRDVLEMTIRQTLIPSLAGIVIGLSGAYFLSNLMAGLLGSFVRVDGWTFLICGMVLLVTALLASYLPARRATRIDPLIALRDG